jgi:outer membrane protein OmpA-like peptidoglycan-associated protein
MDLYRWQLGWWVALALPTDVGAQVPLGNGLQGAYYAGPDFEQLIATRHDATLNFDWHEHRPVAGVAAEQFSVRWTGWLVPPRTGRYVLHLSSDDGSRLWLGERQLLDDWRGQGLNYHQVAVELHAGQAYALRLDYHQATAATRLQLAWELPATPAAPATGRHRGDVVAANAGPVVVPTRYLFRSAPLLPPVPPLVQAAVPSSPLPPVKPPAASTSLLVVHPNAEAAAKLRPRSYLFVGASRSLTPSVPAPRDSDRVTEATARLAKGQPVTLRALYFEQGQAVLLPAVQASLDTLARALASQPALRLEVQGHTDNQGDAALNQRLSQQRAAAVCGYLTSHGVAANRLRAVGYGGARPVADNHEPSQRLRNRRVVLKPLGRKATGG